MKTRKNKLTSGLNSRVDGMVGLSTCDKIVPAQLMALARINLPAIMVTGGYMLLERFKGHENIHVGYKRSTTQIGRKENYQTKTTLNLLTVPALQQEPAA